MRDPHGWRFPTHPQSRHPAAEETRRAVAEETAAEDIERWRTGIQARRTRVRRESMGFRLLRGLAALIVLVVAVAVGSSWLTERAYRDRIYPNVVAGGVAVGSLTADEAKTKLDDALTSYLDAPVSLRFGGSQWQPSASDLGLSADLDATLAAAMAAGRSGPVGPVLVRTLLHDQAPLTVPLRLQLDEAVLRQYVAAIGGQVDREAAAPTLRATADGVVIEGGGPGYTFLAAETAGRVRRALRSMSRGPVDVAVYTTPGQVPAEELQRAQQEARTVASQPVTLVSGDKSWQIGTQQLRDWVRSQLVREPGQQPRLAISLDGVQLRAYIERLSREINTAPQNARLKWEGGQLSVLRPGQPGRELDIDQTVQLVQQAARGRARTVQLPVIGRAPEVSESSLYALGITDVVGTGESGFAQAPPEHANNVQKAADAVTGFVVPAGADFSFKAAIGAVTEAQGYQPELVGDSQRAVLGPATGISQVSTTVFRAALRAGLPILERHGASYRVEYYEQAGQTLGTDAVITLPSEDVRWRNSTSAAILVQISVSGDRVRVDLYGTSPGWSVDIGQPQVTNIRQPVGDVYWTDPKLKAGQQVTFMFASAGADVVVQRRVLSSGSVVLEDQLNSSYAPLPTVFARGK